MSLLAHRLWDVSTTSTGRRHHPMTRGLLLRVPLALAFAFILVEFEVQRNFLFQRSICRGTTDMYAVLSVSGCPLAVSPVRQVVRFFRNKIGERVVGVCLVNPQSHHLALTGLKVNLLKVYEPLSRLPRLGRQG